MWKEDIEILSAEKVIIPQNNIAKPYYNPSIVRYKDKLLISIRSSTWTLGAGGFGQEIIGGALHTDVLLGEVNKSDLTVDNLVKLKYAGNVHEYIKKIGLEDARLFVRDDKLYAIGVCMSKYGGGVYIAQGEIKGDEIRFGELVPKPHPERVEKNWTVPEVPSELFDYIYSPTQVLRNGILIGEHEYHGLLHGGSQAIRWENGWMSFQHKVYRMHHENNAGVRQYVNYAVKYNNEGFATEISQGFLLFGDNIVEFISGLVESDGKLLISMGVGDARCVLAKIDYKDLRFAPYDWRAEPIRAYLPTTN